MGDGKVARLDRGHSTSFVIGSLHAGVNGTHDGDGGEARRTRQGKTDRCPESRTRAMWRSAEATSDAEPRMNRAGGRLRLTRGNAPSKACRGRRTTWNCRGLTGKAAEALMSPLL
jgi:hypothetical protein